MKAARSPRLERSDRVKRAAYGFYNAALAKGLLVRPDACSKCGKVCRVHGHHADYNKPLDVEWLCAGCHSRRHREWSNARPRCIECGRIILRRFLDNGHVVGTPDSPSVAHTRCPEPPRRGPRPSPALAAVMSRYLGAERVA